MFVGKFSNLHDEEYIARSFEDIGYDVIRVEQSMEQNLIHRHILLKKPDILLFTKWQYRGIIEDAIQRGRSWGLVTVCWLFDLYWNYDREFFIKTAHYFKADYVVTTDGGNDEKWKAAGINHRLVRQGIYSRECYLDKVSEPSGIVFVGSENPCYPQRTQLLLGLRDSYANFKWLGRVNTNTIRGVALNRLYSRTKIVVGDSVYSPYYWSNRIVETLGRGGFLIHRDVPGLKEEYPHLVTYDGTFEDLERLIDYYMAHEDERLEIVQKNYEWVKSKYTMDKKCAELMSLI